MKRVLDYSARRWRFGWPPSFLVSDGNHLLQHRGVIWTAEQAKALLEYAASSIDRTCDLMRFRLRRTERLEENILGVPEGAAGEALLNYSLDFGLGDLDGPKIVPTLIPYPGSPVRRIRFEYLIGA